MSSSKNWSKYFQNIFSHIYYFQAHKANEEEFLEGIERNTIHNVNLNKDINQLLIERDDLLVKLNEESFKYHVVLNKIE